VVLPEVVHQIPLVTAQLSLSQKLRHSQLLNSIQNVCLSVVPAPHLFIGIELLLLSLQEIIVFAAATASVSNL
jgi:hypothetical protein